jgi:hypothetical protein
MKTWQQMLRGGKFITFNFRLEPEFLASLKSCKSKRRGYDLIEDYKLLLRDLAMTNDEEINAIARWYHAIYSDTNGGLRLNVLKPVASILHINIPTAKEGKSAGYKSDFARQLLRDRLMLDSIL